MYIMHNIFPAAGSIQGRYAFSLQLNCFRVYLLLFCIQVRLQYSPMRTKSRYKASNIPEKYNVKTIATTELTEMLSMRDLIDSSFYAQMGCLHESFCRTG